MKSLNTLNICKPESPLTNINGPTECKFGAGRLVDMNYQLLPQNLEKVEGKECCQANLSLLISNIMLLNHPEMTKKCRWPGGGMLNGPTTPKIVPATPLRGHQAIIGLFFIKIAINLEL